ncbi:hypothetical protein BS17DRAFT_811782 [Gyrodon lividus]|nr:hypothetical protein BS17DRAFT_811782 [Gyrodon lividus]
MPTEQWRQEQQRQEQRSGAGTALFWGTLTSNSSLFTALPPLPPQMPPQLPNSPSSRRTFSTRRIPCPHASCNCWFKTLPGLKHHQSSLHSFTFSSESTNVTTHHHPPAQPAPGVTWDYHEKLTVLAGDICDADGHLIDASAIPLPVSDKSADDWGLYGDKLRMLNCEEGKLTSFANSGGAHYDLTAEERYPPVQTAMTYTKLLMPLKLATFSDIPPWMDIPYDFWFRPAYSLVERQLSNTDFDGEFDYTPYRDFTGENEEQHYENFMSEDWAWMQADRIAVDPSMHGSTFVPIILGSNKTTVSVATGQNDYWPVYLSIGNTHNNVWHAHRNAVELLAFYGMQDIRAQNNHQL